MPSPFPGMDPYLEAPALWPDVHHSLIEVIREMLVPLVRPKYAVRVEQRVYVNDIDDPAYRLMVPDLRVVTGKPTRLSPRTAGDAAVVTVPVPVAELLDEEITEARVEIIDRADRSVVTVIEVVSPSNKVRGAAGRRAFVGKRREVTASPSHWLEIDLLRGGARTVVPVGVPQSDYLVYLDRSSGPDRTRCAWPISLDQTLPVVAVPLREPDGDAPLDLQAAVELIYERAGYDLEVDYALDPEPALPSNLTAWVDGMLREKKLR